MGKPNGITRRRMLQLTGVGVLGTGALLAGAGCSGNAGGSTEDGKAASEGFQLTVYDPTGNVEITESFVDRLDTLDGKTVAFVGDGMWEDDRTFEVIGRLLQEKYSNVTIITQDNFPQTVDSISKSNNGIAETMIEMGVDGAIVGNAG